MHKKLEQLSGGASSTSEIQPGQGSEQTFTPAVSVRKSLASRDHIFSLIDGRPYKTLSRHLSRHGLTPDAYRARYKLKADYPMVAEGYSEQRRETAKRLGLGRKPKAPSEPADPVEQTPAAARNAKRGGHAKAQPAT